MRVVTYNIHKCRGLDGRVRADRILHVLKEIDADVIALQEVVCAQSKDRKRHQAHYLAEELGFHVRVGENRRHNDGAYGNVLLSRFPFYNAQNYDLSVAGRERRGCLWADLRLRDGGSLHIFNLHLGTSFFERRKQARRLFKQGILTDAARSRNRIVLGDFNEWTSGLVSRLLHTHFQSTNGPERSRFKSYPGLLPLLHLDHIYFDGDLKLKHFAIHRSRLAVLASDHLPLIAEFGFPRIRPANVSLPTG